MIGRIAMLGVVRILIAQLAAFLALLLLASAVHKAFRWPHTRRVVRDFAGVPAAPSSVTALAAALDRSARRRAAVRAGPSPGGSGAGGALVGGVLGAHRARHRPGPARSRLRLQFRPGASSRSGAFQVARNALLVFLALLVAVSAAGGSVPVTASQVLAACALLALYGALDQVMALQPLRRGEVL